MYNEILLWYLEDISIIYYSKLKFDYTENIKFKIIWNIALNGKISFTIVTLL